MSTDDFLQQYEAALQAQSAAATAVKVLEMRAKLQFEAKPTAVINHSEDAEIGKYIAENRTRLDQDDVDILKEPWVSCAAIADYMEISKVTVGRWLKAGKLEGKKINGEHRISTLSAVKKLLDGKT